MDRQLINNENIIGLPEQYIEQEIYIPIGETSLDDILSKNIIEMVDGNELDYDIFQVSYKGNIGYTLVISKNTEQTRALLIPYPVGDVIRFYREFQDEYDK